MLFMVYMYVAMCSLIFLNSNFIVGFQAIQEFKFVINAVNIVTSCAHVSFKSYRQPTDRLCDFRGHVLNLCYLKLLEDINIDFLFSCFIKGLMHVNGRPVAAFDPEGLIFAAGVDSEMVKLYDLRSFDKVVIYLVKLYLFNTLWNINYIQGVF